MWNFFKYIFAIKIYLYLEVAAIVAFGYGEKTAKKLRLNILSMSQIDVRAEQQYYAPKKGVHDLVHMGSCSNKSGLTVEIAGGERSGVEGLPEHIVVEVHHLVKP